MKHLPWPVRLAVTGFLAWLAAAASIWLLGTAWWSVLIAALCVVATMVPALRKREVPHA